MLTHSNMVQVLLRSTLEQNTFETLKWNLFNRKLHHLTKWLNSFLHLYNCLFISYWPKSYKWWLNVTIVLWNNLETLDMNVHIWYSSITLKFCRNTEQATIGFLSRRKCSFPLHRTEKGDLLVFTTLKKIFPIVSAKQLHYICAQEQLWPENGRFDSTETLSVQRS